MNDRVSVILVHSRAARSVVAAALRACKVRYSYMSSASVKGHTGEVGSPTPRYTMDTTVKQWSCLMRELDKSTVRGIDAYRD